MTDEQRALEIEREKAAAKERRRYALLQAAAIIRSGDGHSRETAFYDATWMLRQIEKLEEAEPQS